MATNWATFNNVFTTLALHWAVGGHCTSSVIVCVCYAALSASDTILLCLKIRLIDIHQRNESKSSETIAEERNEAKD